ncbi:hypothetical protein [Streptomyces sp. NPDC053560]|uniref:hypothetical protein n=1 Tax=Streptomyces sp. NPDC053560 TaxID=3365711 RepID=UPI0037CDD2DD
MVTRHRVTLQFAPGGPTVEGEWTAPATAKTRYTQWVGLYGTDPDVVIQLIEETDGQRRVRKTWTTRGEATGDAAH